MNKEKIIFCAKESSVQEVHEAVKETLCERRETVKEKGEKGVLKEEEAKGDKRRSTEE